MSPLFARPEVNSIGEVSAAAACGMTTYEDVLRRHGINVAGEARQMDREMIEQLERTARHEQAQAAEAPRMELIRRTARALIENGRVRVVVEGAIDTNPSFTCPVCGALHGEASSTMFEIAKCWLEAGLDPMRPLSEQRLDFSLPTVKLACQCTRCCPPSGTTTRYFFQVMP